ncbi:MAG: flagellar export chaperone FliS [Phycisphaerae bacterium]|jgi:flagellar protein FliS|nr:flagellar export chaperone FliS [Phycisphaerae bacterium]MCZ2401124.1 flagellar export chaperone FliS [Phycisphaerae bacterium]NUQ50729.1 flagellar export chaperone FliS [Phycisphaerae bacterium]
MSQATHKSFEYLKSAVMTATPEQLQLMLLDGAIRFSTKAREALEKRDIEGTFNALERAQRIVLELINGMNRDANPELVDQMAGLYNFIYRRLVEASMKRDTQAVADALRILEHQRETWRLLIDKVSRAAQPATAAQADPPAGAGHSAGALSLEV